MAKNNKADMSCARVKKYTASDVSKAERHNERKNETYENMNVIEERIPFNVHFKKPFAPTYMEQLKQMENDGMVSLRGLRKDATLFNEIVIDVNTMYFERNGGYEYAKKFYEEAYHFIEEKFGAENVISAVMHADEINVAATEELGKEVYHYHLHAMVLPVVEKEILWSKRCKDEKLRGTVKEVVNQISHSKKWKSDIPLTDEKGNPLLRKNGKPMFRASYSILQDELFNYMTEQGFKGFQRGEYGSTAEHLTSLQYQIKQDKERLEKLQKRIQKEQVKYEPARHISKTLNEIDGMGQKTLTGKMAISKEDYSQLTALAKEGITSRAEINKLEQNANYYRQKYFDSANALEKMKTKYNELKERCRPFLEALEHFPEVAKLFTEKVRQLFSFKEEQQRAEKVRNKMVDSSVDNMLLITNDGRKLALDQRMINSMLPDSDTSKVSACADNVFNIWQKTADNRSTQMVFCDLSTPHGDGSFNVYDDLRDKLTAKGVPKEEIAYIHSANSEAQKKELFGKVRSGQVRVLIGSTQKMGAGTNVQKKLIALHHLDCPWRPSDLQQREGRIIRQGNENPEVEIYTYVTENTFDSYLYQLVESKQKFIGQIMTSKSPVRSAEDVDEQALSYAEIKALCTGNPYIKEKMDLDIDVSRLKLLKANHLSQIYSLEDKIHKEFPAKIAALEERIKGYDRDIKTAENNHAGDKDSFCGMVIKGLTFAEKKDAGEAILAACKAMTNPDPIMLGSYRGFDTELSFDTFGKEYRITLIGELRHTVPLGTDIFGNILRLDNAIGAMSERQIACKEQLEDTKVQLENARVESQKPFPHDEELKAKSARLAELNTLLDMDKKDNELVDGERGEESEEPDRSGSRDER